MTRGALVNASQEQELHQLRATIAESTSGLMTELDKETVDEKALNRHREALEKARQRMLELNVERMITMRGILTYQQWHTLRERSPRSVTGETGMSPMSYGERPQRPPARQ